MKDARFDEATFESASLDGEDGFAGVAFQGDAWFDGATFQGVARFDRATFAGDARFRGATFQGVARFDEATFAGDARFDAHDAQIARQTTFRALARFNRATFRRDAAFSLAVFQGDAAFHGATFQRDGAFYRTVFARVAWFDEQATFQREAEFTRAVFQRDARFASATFHSGAVFGKVTFQGTADFREATFQHVVEVAATTIQRDGLFQRAAFARAQHLGPMLVRKGLVLDDAIFQERVQIEVSAGALCCRRTRFLAGVQLRVRWAQVVLDDADLAAPSILTGVSPFPNLDEGRWARALERLLPEPHFKPELRARPRLLSLRRADVAGLTVASVDLRACWFVGAHHLDRLRIGEEASLGYSPRNWRWTTRLAIAEERYWRVHPHGDGTTFPDDHAANAVDLRSGAAGRSYDDYDIDWYGPANRPPAWLAMEPPSPLQIAVVYRALRKGREDSRDGAMVGTCG